MGSDFAGTISIGGGSVTSCKLTFSNSYLESPVCIISTTSSGLISGISSSSSEGFKASFSASLGGGKMNYICIGMSSVP
jgi:hypothetical protein